MSDTPRTDALAFTMEDLGPGGRALYGGRLWTLAYDLERDLTAARAENEALRTELSAAIARAEKAEAERAEERTRAEVAEYALQLKGYKKSCDVAACNCGDQWTHGGHAERRLTEIREALLDADMERNGKTILGVVCDALGRMTRAEAERDELRAELDRLTTLRPASAWDRYQRSPEIGPKLMIAYDALGTFPDAPTTKQEAK